MKSIKLLSAILLLLSSTFITAQDVIIPIETKNTATVLKTDGDKQLKILYFGKTLSNAGEYAQTEGVYNFRAEGARSNNNAFTVAGIDNNFVEPAIAVVHSDGNNSLNLRYQSHKTSGTSDGAMLTTITLKDPNYPFYVYLYLKLFHL